MKNFTISFLGRDCPGVVATVSRTLGESGCNIMQGLFLFISLERIPTQYLLLNAVKCWNSWEFSVVIWGGPKSGIFICSAA